MGRELALQLCHYGVAVACVDINVETCAGTVQSARHLHGICKGYQCDVRDKEAVCISLFKSHNIKYDNINPSVFKLFLLTLLLIC